MAEINDFNVTDASNTARWPEDMAPSAVNNAGRADEGLLARWHKDTNGSMASTGSADAYVLAANQTIASYYDGLELVFNANFSNTGPATLNVDGVGATTIIRENGEPLKPTDIFSGGRAQVIYDGTNWRLRTYPHTYLNVRRGGVKGDGSTDDRANIQTLIEDAYGVGGGRIYAPGVNVDSSEYYKIDGMPLQMRDNVHLVGDGYSSLIRNPDTSGTAINQYCVLFGLCANAFVEDDYTKYTIADTAAGANSVTTDTAADAGNFTVGQIIVVMNGPNYLIATKPTYHDYTLTRVKSRDGGTGVIGLEHALNVPYVTSGAVSPQVFDPNEAGVTLDHGFAAFGTQRAGLYNLGFESEGRITARGGALECYMGNLWTKGESSPVYGNLYAHCTFENIWSTVGNRFIELKQGSHDNIVRNINGQYDSTVGTLAANVPIDIGESARSNLIDGWFLDMGDVDPAGQAVLLSSAKRNKVVNGTFQTGTFNGTVFGCIKSVAGSPDDMRCEYNTIAHNTVSAQVAVGRFWDLNSHDANACRRNRIVDNDFFGSVISDAGRVEGTENRVTGNYHEDGGLNWSGGGGGGATKNFIIGNSFPDAFTPSAAGIQSDLAANYAWKNVDATGFTMNNDSALFVRPISADFTIPDQGHGFGLTNASAAGPVVVTLPVAVRGKRFRGYREASFAFRFDPNGSEQIRRNDGTLGGAGKYVEIGSDDGYLDFDCLVDGIWFLAVEVGTITLEP